MPQLRSFDPVGLGRGPDRHADRPAVSGLAPELHGEVPRVSGPYYRKPSKYKNEKVTVFGEKFDSKKEGDRYIELLAKERRGEIHRLKLQPEFDIVIRGVPIKFKSGRQMRYRADFQYTDSKGNVVIEDVKGMKTDVYRIKQALMLAMGYTINEI